MRRKNIMSFTPAVKHQKKLRLALYGASGSGKTYTALTFAKVLAGAGRIAVFDTERGRASLYADTFPIDAMEVEDEFDPNLYIKAIAEAGEAGYRVLVIDSLSHAWTGAGGVLDKVNNTRGNQFTDGWGKVGTPLQNKMMSAILRAPLHVIATMRTKTEYVVEQDERGKSVPKRIGTGPVQRADVEYEFDFVGSMEIEGNRLRFEKSPIVPLHGKTFPQPTGEVMQKILDWLSNGTPSDSKPKLPAPESKPKAPELTNAGAEKLSPELVSVEPHVTNANELLVEANKLTGNHYANIFQCKNAIDPAMKSWPAPSDTTTWNKYLSTLVDRVADKAAA